MNETGTRGMWRNGWSAAAAFLLLLPFAVLTGFFRSVDVYHNHFFTVAPSLALCYNAARLGLGLLLFWSCLGLGTVFTDLLGLPRKGEREGRPALRGVERLLLDFFTGGTLLGTLWYGLGLLGLLRWPVAVAVHAAVLVLSSPALGRLLHRGVSALGPEGLRRSVHALREVCRRGPADLAGAVLLGLTIAAALAAALANFAYNALVPGGTHDVFVHYFPYLAQVLQSGTTMPGAGSDVWYHFFYSKSEGLFFAASLLSDPLGAQVASGVYVLLAGLCVYALLRIPLLPPHLAWAGMAAFHLAFLTGADFVFHQKGHIIMLGNLACLLWLATRLWQADTAFCGRGGEGRFGLTWRGVNWPVSVLCLVHGVGVTLNAPAAFSAALPLAGGLLLLCLFSRSRRVAAPGLFALCLGLCLGLATTFALNYTLVGMAEITPFKTFWRHADQERFSRWVSPYLMVLLDQGSSDMGQVAGLRLKLLFKSKYYADVFKTAQVAGLFCLPLLAAAALAGAVHLRRADAGMKFVLRRLRTVAAPALLFCCVIVAVGLGTRQDVSYVRFTGFALLPVVLLGGLLWQWFLVCPLSPPCRIGLWAGGFALAIMAACAATVPERLPQDDRDAAVAFLSGRLTIAEQYTRLCALWPPATEIRRLIPSDARVRLLHIGTPTESMAPFAPLETDISFSLRGGWHTVMFGTPEEAMACLRGQGLNHFLFDAGRPFFDMIIHSPLFTKESLARNFRVAWRQGDAYLLTWAGAEPDVSADMTALLARWDDCLAASEAQTPTRALFLRVREIYEANGRSATRVVTPSGLPPVRGWQ